MKKQLQLRSVTSSEFDLTNWEPDSLEDTFVCLDIEVGFSNDDEGTNLFYVTLATPESLRKHRKGPILVEHRTLVIDHYDYKHVFNGLVKIIEKCQRDSWNECCQALQRYFQWEYEDYIISEC